MVTLFTDYFEKQYRGKAFSCVTLFCIIAFLLAVFIPYVVVYTSGSNYYIYFLNLDEFFRYVEKIELIF